MSKNNDEMNWDYTNKVNFEQLTTIIVKYAELFTIYKTSDYDQCEFEEFKKYIDLLIYRHKSQERRNHLPKYRLLSVAVISKHIENYRFRFKLLDGLVLDKILYDIEVTADFNNSKKGEVMIKNNIVKRKMDEGAKNSV